MPELALAAGASARFLRRRPHLSNTLIAGVAVVFAAFAGNLRTSLWFATAGLAFLPLVLAYWQKGYAALPESAFRDDAFGLEYALPAWRDSAVWGWTVVLALLVPFAVVGFFTIPRPPALLLSAWILSTAGLLTRSSPTPRCTHGSSLSVLPAVFVFWGAGAMALRNRALYGSFMPRP